MTLTVTEKEHWKERVNARIDKKISQIWDQHQDIKEALSRQAEEETLEKLEVKEKYRQLKKAKVERSELDQRISGLEQDLIQQLGKHFHATSYSWDSQLQSEIGKTQKKLMRDTEPGRQIAKLELEKENSLDAVWLATSSKQIRELWTQVEDLIGSSDSQLTRSAMKIEPVQE